MIDLVWQAPAQQRVFRQLLDAYSYPGKVQTLADTLPTAAYHTLLATLLDGTSSLCDRDGLLEATQWSLLQAKPASASSAQFIVCDGAQAADFTPLLGTLADPEQSATVLLAVANIGSGTQALRLRGPGIQQETTLELAGLHPSWLAQRAEWCCHFPLGVDCILTDAQRRFVAIPRTTQLEGC
jgi:alpha-D-ribose 1-methylphosphonate 5-triphosphate synthase subunit PhnH